MRQWKTFTKKEILEQFRTGRLLFFAIIFVLFGVMNPAIAKLTPWMMELMSEQLAETGMVVTAVEVDAMTSWTQFFKNMPFALIIFLILFSGILTTEYQKGTLINIVTKGMKRWKILFAKTAVAVALWSLGFFTSFGITYLYNDWFWDNGAAHNVPAAAACLYLLGVWLISLLVMASAFCNSSGTVMLIVGGAFLISYLLGLFPAVGEYVPTSLMDSAALLAGAKELWDYGAAVVVTVMLVVLQSVISVAVFNKKNL